MLKEYLQEVEVQNELKENALAQCLATKLLLSCAPFADVNYYKVKQYIKNSQCWMHEILQRQILLHFFLFFSSFSSLLIRTYSNWFIRSKDETVPHILPTNTTSPSLVLVVCSHFFLHHYHCIHLMSAIKYIYPSRRYQIHCIPNFPLNQ